METSSPSGNDSVHSSRKCNSISDDDSGCAADEYSFIPSGLSPVQIHQFMCSHPKTKAPYVSSNPGEKHRIRQLLRQLPPQDSKSYYCIGLSDEEKNEFQHFQITRKRDAFGRGSLQKLAESTQVQFCEQCHKRLTPGELVVSASRAGPHVSWHPACFVCCMCHELLVDLIYFYRDGKIYCGRHHAETLKPRCVTCDEIIFADQCTEAEGCNWHTRHFVCSECGKPLAGQSYRMRNGRPHCCQCFELLYSDHCETCTRVICEGDSRMTLDGHQWHASDSCFSCKSCRQSPMSRPCQLQKSELHCTSECHTRKKGWPVPKEYFNHDKPQKWNNKRDMSKLSKEDHLYENCVDFSVAYNHNHNIKAGINHTLTELDTEYSVTDESQSIEETDSGLYLTFQASDSCIPGKDTTFSDHSDMNSNLKCKNTSKVAGIGKNDTESVFECACSTKEMDMKASKDCKDYLKETKELPVKCTQICLTNYMIDPENHRLNSPAQEKSPTDCFLQKQQIPRSSPASQKAASRFSGTQEHNALYPLPRSPVSTSSGVLCRDEVEKMECLRLQSPQAFVEGPWEKDPSRSRTDLKNTFKDLACKKCKYCNSIDCKCNSKTSLPDLAYTSVVVESDWRRVPKNHFSPTTPNSDMHRKSRNEGSKLRRHATSGYSSDGAVKWRSTRRHHAQEVKSASNLMSRRSIKLGTRHVPRACEMSLPDGQFPPASHRHQLLGNATSSWQELTKDQIANRLSALNLEWEDCSTCSSSSDSEFDYYYDRQSIKSPDTVMSQSLSLSSPSSRRPKKRKIKQCVIS